MRSAVAALALGLTLAAAGLSSCASPQVPMPPPTPDPSVTPVYASEEEALAAAEELYGRYLDAENKLGQGGWADVSIVEPYVRGDALESEKETAANFASMHYRQVGDVKFDSIRLQRIEDHGAGSVTIGLYLCLDFATADVQDSSGDSVVVANRPDRLSMEIGLDDADGVIKISRSETWSGSTFC